MAVMVYILKISSGNITSSDHQISAAVLGNMETGVLLANASDYSVVYPYGCAQENCISYQIFTRLQSVAIRTG